MNISPRIPQPIAAQGPPRWLAVSRGAALGIGFLLTLNFFEILHLNTSPTENWFCSLTPLPERLGLVVLAMAVPSFILFALRPGLPGPVRNALLLIIALLSACTARDCREISMAVPETLLFAAISRPLSVIVALLATAAGLLLGTQRRQSGNLSVVTMLAVATITAAGFPLACIQSDATFRPLPQRPLLIVPEMNFRSHNSEQLPDVAATTASAWKLHPNSKILLCTHELPNKPDPLPEQALQLLTDAGVPREAIIVQTVANSPSAHFEMLRSRPELQKSPPIQLAIAAPGYRLARLKFLARRHGLDPLLIPIGTDAAALESPVESSIETLLECWSMLKQMAEPASEYLQGVRPPSETQIQYDQPGDESIDPGQLLKELQDSAATEP